MDIEWLLSTLFDASLLSPWAAGNGGYFFVSIWITFAIWAATISRY